MKKKILITLLIIVVLLVISYLIFFLKNNSILNSILSKENEYKSESNIYVEAKIYNENNASDVTVNKLSRKDNLYKLERKQENGESTIFLYDSETKQTQVYNTTTEKLENVEDKNFVISSPMYTLLSDYEDSEITKLALTKWISSESIEGTECYKVETERRIIWIDKETWLPKKIEFLQTSSTGSVVTFSDWKLNSLTDEDIELP